MNPEMMEALQALAADRGITVDTLFAALAEALEAAYKKQPDAKEFAWVNTMIGNVKRSINGTYHAINPKHLPRYLAEFCYRFNRRFDLAAILPRLGSAAVRTPPMPHRLLVLAEPC